MVGDVVAATHQQRPDRARHLVGKRDGCDLELLLLQQAEQLRIRLARIAAGLGRLGPGQPRHRTKVEQPSQIAVALLAD